MNARFECFGFSVARKHVYFYATLLLATLAANTMKEQLAGGSSQAANDSLVELSRFAEQVGLRPAPSQP